MSETLTLPVLPLDDQVVLPGMVVPLETSQAEVSAAIDAARMPSRQVPGVRSEARARVLLVPRLPDRGLAGVGTLATVEQVGRLPGGQPGALVRGVARVKIGSGTTGPGAALWVQGTVIEETGGGPRADELAQQYKTLVTGILQQRGAWQVIDMVQQLNDASAVADNAGYASYLTTGQKLQLLETTDLVERLELVIGWTREHLAELDVAESIRKDVTEGMEKQQREFLLRQQLAAIRKELADLNGDAATEEDDYRARVEAADLPEAVRDAALKEVDKLERTPDASPETGWIRTWLDTVLDIPWNERTEDAYDIAGARRVLDEDHTGLDDVKERIIEYLAVRKRREDRGLGIIGGRRSGAVLALVGPPGVGKTSLGESVARAMDRKFVRVALGGVRDEAEIRGHRRTYVGALPGRIVRAIREAGTMNPVVLLDEVDKIGADYRGDPASALLEVLDPAQNHTFRDHYLEVELDLSDVVFLATANVLEGIPGPLLDRMELVQLDGYTEDEKVLIARDHLLPRQLSKAGLNAEEVSVGEDALRLLAAEYTHEAGVRSLERSIARILRKVAARRGPGRRHPAGHRGRGRAQGLPGTAAVHAGDQPGRARPPDRRARRGHRPGGDRRGRGCPVHRGVAGRPGDRRDRGHAHRSARRRDEGVGPDRAVLPALARRRTQPAGRRAEGPWRARARAGRRGAQGRPERGRHDDHRARVAAVRPAGARRRGHDRRGVPHRPGAAHRRGQAEAAGRASGRDHHRADPAAERAGPR